MFALAPTFHRLDVVSATRPKNTFDGSAQGKSPCEKVISKDLVDRQEEGRIGVHVESEVVLKCEGYNNVRHAVLDVRNDCFCETHET